MNEGWLNDEYLILFSGSEIEDASKKYGIAQTLLGYTVLGLLGWDDFIVRDPSGKTYSVPTVPIDKKYLKEHKLPQTVTLEADGRFKEKIKWYVKPLVFGGDPNDEENLTWVTHEQHAQLVVWWNNQYRALKEQNA
jgi:hypothetical protein